MTAELIARLESADGPDRELDCRIWCVMRGADFDLYSQVVPNFNEWQAPRYTTSIDAALMLVPEGWSYVLQPGYVQLLHPRTLARDKEGHSKTTPLALCIAALRAQQKDTNA